MPKRRPQKKMGMLGACTSQMDAPPPVLVTLRQKQKAQALREELSGQAAKKAVAKVSLPKFSFQKEDSTP